VAQRKRRKRNPGRLHAETMAGEMEPPSPATIPTRWVKFVVALFLIPPAWVLTKTFFSAFARSTIEGGFWATEEFWFFGLGCTLWIVAFLFLPKPVWIYVLGHESTHAIWVWLHGGRVANFHAGTTGGHVLADRINTWIALAPYFFPIYSLLVIAIYGLVGLFVQDMAPLRPLLYMLVGATWAFHLTFTFWMILKDQPDLHYGGTLFSLLVIYILNLLILCAMLLATAKDVTAMGFGRDLVSNAADFSQWLVATVKHVGR